MSEYEEGQPVALLHGPDGPKHHICLDCMSKLQMINCPMCRQSVNYKTTKFGKSIFVTRFSS